MDSKVAESKVVEKEYVEYPIPHDFIEIPTDKNGKPAGTGVYLYGGYNIDKTLKLIFPPEKFILSGDKFPYAEFLNYNGNLPLRELPKDPKYGVTYVPHYNPTNREILIDNGRDDIFTYEIKKIITKKKSLFLSF